MDNSYGSADSRSLCDCNCNYWTIVMALLIRDRPATAIVTIGQ
ncbi:MAG: hypothetical protein SWX82_33150 [Cyanobacteriota bacterium]|nr:hypothetical protein [Cyanobacteriota bacterium]